LGGCENLKEVPQAIGSISSLSILYLSYGKSIESLLTTFGDLKHLTKLKLGGCEKFEGASSKHWKHLLMVNIELIVLQVH
jgi:hypothetical protein